MHNQETIPKELTKKKINWLIIALPVAIVCALAIGSVYLYNSGKLNWNNTAKDTATTENNSATTAQDNNTASLSDDSEGEVDSTTLPTEIDNDLNSVDESMDSVKDSDYNQDQISDTELGM